MKPRKISGIRILLLATLLLFAPITIAVVKKQLTTTWFSPPKEMIEGLVGQPQLLNPLFSRQNPVDQTISNLIFRGLIRYNSAAEPVSDLAESWEVSEDGKSYTFKLRTDLKWHDGASFTADDVIFTYQLTQSEAYQGPEKDRFQKIQIVKQDLSTVRFDLQEPFAPFLEVLTMGVLPAHLWKDLPIGDLKKGKFNLSPVGTGPIRLDSLELNRSPQTIRSMKFKSSSPTTNFQLIFRFYQSEEDLLTALKLGEINSFSTTNSALVQKIKAWPNQTTSTYVLKKARWAIFFNLEQNLTLQNKNLKSALAYSIPKDHFDGKTLSGPIPASSWAFATSLNEYPFDLDLAKSTLDQAALDLPLSLTITSSDHSAPLQMVQILQESWEKLGVNLNTRILRSSELSSAVQNRDFEMVLLLQEVGYDPDQYIFWHTSQKDPPGLNITAYSNRRVDKVLVEGRKTVNQNERKTSYEEFQKQVTQDLPAIFLHQPYLYHVVSRKIKDRPEEKEIGDPNERFEFLFNNRVDTAKAAVPPAFSPSAKIIKGTRYLPVVPLILKWKAQISFK